MKKTSFKPGENIAMKVPPEDFDATVSFYREVLGLRVLKKVGSESVVFDFGGKNLWIDKVSSLSQAEIWLEVSAHDTKSAAKHLKQKGVVRRDEIEPLPPDINAFWIKNPAGIIHLVSEE